MSGSSIRTRAVNDTLLDSGGIIPSFSVNIGCVRLGHALTFARNIFT